MWTLNNSMLRFILVSTGAKERLISKLYMDQRVIVRVEDLNAKVALNKKKTFHHQIGLKCEMLHYKHSLV
jgi:hypothetical protein